MWIIAEWIMFLYRFVLWMETQLNVGETLIWPLCVWFWKLAATFKLFVCFFRRKVFKFMIENVGGWKKLESLTRIRLIACTISVLLFGRGTSCHPMSWNKGNGNYYFEVFFLFKVYADILGLFAESKDYVCDELYNLTDQNRTTALDCRLESNLQND